MVKKINIILFVLLLFIISCDIKINEMKTKNKSITIEFTGDVMLGRLVNDYVILGNKPLDYVWGNMVDILKNADLTLKILISLRQVTCIFGKDINNLFQL